MISDARKGDDDFTIWLTNPTNEFELPDIGKGVQAFFDAEKAAGRTYRVNQRKSAELSVVIELWRQVANLLIRKCPQMRRRNLRDSATARFSWFRISRGREIPLHDPLKIWELSSPSES